VLTIDAAGERLGLTVATALALSDDPPLAGVSVSRHAAMHELLHEAGGFALSLLAAGQEAVAQHFARGVPPFAHWHGVATRAGSGGAPLIDGAVGWLECTVRSSHETGDHTLFVGQVVAAERGRPGPPLVYLDRRYLVP